MHIRHVIAGVGSSAPLELQRAHAQVLASVARAFAAATPRITVEIIVVGLPDEPPPPGPWVFHATRREALGGRGFATRRALPFLSDVIAPLQQADEFRIGILSNADIEIVEDFYERVAVNFRSIPVPTSITRLTHYASLQPGNSSDHGPTTTEHPGHDCFVADSADWHRAAAGDVVLGIPGVMKALLWSLARPGIPVRVLHGTGWTHHQEDARAWAAAKMGQYVKHNEIALTSLAEELLSLRGDGFLATVPSMRPYLGREPDQRTMVFSLNPGRSGSESLARLMTTFMQVNSVHERAPTMMGPWLRMVGFRGQAETEEQRRFKARLVEKEREDVTYGIYADTSHLFLYTFSDVVLDHFQEEDIVLVRLHRDPLEVALSYINLGYFSRTSTLGMDWYFWPTWPTSLIPMSIEDIRSEWDLVFGSLIDFYRRQALFLARYSGRLRVIPLRTRDLVDAAWQDGLASSIGVRRDTSAATRMSVLRWNQKRNERVRALSYEQVSQEFALFCRRFAIDSDELDRLGWGGPF